MITQRDLVQQLARRDPGAWTVVERVQDIAHVTEQPARQRRDHRTRLTLIVHKDVPRGRGTARVDLGALDGSAADLVDRTIALALTTVGPAWASPPAAAPARVDLVDPDLVKREIDAVAVSTLTRLRRPDHVAVAATATALRERVTVIASSGFHASWLATALSAHALVATSDHSLPVARQARRADQLHLDTALDDAAADLRLLAAAVPPSPGPCALWLGPDALFPAAALDPAGATSTAADDNDPDAARIATTSTANSTADASPTGTASPTADDPIRGLRDHGLWTIFAHQADAAVERQGLTRYRLHADIARGASQLAEPLSITSDGALDFAPLSLPVTDDAVAIRRFPLIDRGIAVGLGLSPREAALRHTVPNGGVRNLLVAPGTWSPGPAPAPTPRTIEIRRLHAIAIDPSTGDATLDIALGLDHRPDRPSPIPFTGGTLHLDLITALALARRSPQLLTRGAYRGPAAILIDDADLIA